MHPYTELGIVERNLNRRVQRELQVRIHSKINICLIIALVLGVTDWPIASKTSHPQTTTLATTTCAGN
ncbi:unnamed protein product [Mesocestoides corti]|uniref:Transposase n=1 Tax=Mesocestoides corti TaxID=53468 RepID=A0A0R3UI83_MESCO|nr:unnamed protein product [Mesocestoides corti]